METIRKKSILVVDDEHDIVTIIKLYMQRAGWKVDAFTDPVLALKHFEQHWTDYDVVLSDLRMPTMSGFEFLRSIKAINSHVKIFLVTAFVMGKSELEKVLPSLQIDGFIEKPMSMRALVSLIEKQVSV